MDKRCVVGHRARVGVGKASVPNALQPSYLNSGITLIGKGTVIPPLVRIGTNCLVSGSGSDGAIPNSDIGDGGYYLGDEERF